MRRRPCIPETLEEKPPGESLKPQPSKTDSGPDPDALGESSVIPVPCEEREPRLPDPPVREADPC